MTARSNAATVWILVALAVALIYAPPVYLIAISLNPALQPGLPSLGDLSLKWYVALAGEGGLTRALRESLLVATITALAAVALALLAALAYLELRRGRTIWFLAMLLPLFVPGVIQGLALSVIFTRAGITPSALTVAAAHLLWAMPFAFIVILTSMTGLRPSWLMAAADLGANWWQRTRDITLPVLTPGLLSALIFAFLLSLNEFGRAFYLVGRQNTLPIELFGRMNSGADPTIYAISGAIFFVSLLCVGAIFLSARKRT
ncbi:ABC transporter permease [Roseivivax sediminis]|uniref:Spermidine/putrescine transport system permease protein n=1 Tax=Roseivivax sediminis TaxID=936889 RepID=A0A1I1V5U3_9RHOB|nr:ABC transporter permease subunit [Roseivivax sediminis]SFD78412.1 spermidine/putrescine transport system permease protein [Roseivivax sediminis]